MRPVPPLILLLLVFGLVLEGVVGGDGFCSLHDGPANGCGEESLHWKVNSPTLSPSHLQDLPGFTRSVYKKDHALVTPESHVFGPLPDCYGVAIHHVLCKNARKMKIRTSSSGCGEIFELRKLLPTDTAYGFNIHIMDFKPGEFLNIKEVHYDQHGLLLLEGQGIYRLGDNWYLVQAGDVMGMVPFIPQWYAALGKTKTWYLICKDVNRNPLF